MGKKGKKAKDKKVAAEPEEEIPEEFRDLTIPQLREKIEAFQYRLNKSAKERNYMQLEKDMVNRFYQITKDEVKQIEAELLNKDRQMEMMERDHRVHIKVHEQKVQNLEYGHRNDRRQVQQEGEMSIQQECEAHGTHLVDMGQEKDKYKKDLKERALANEDDVKMLKQGFAKNLLKLRETFEANHKAAERHYDEQVEDLKIDLELRRKVDIHEIEERKNQHINDLLMNHQEAFDLIKSYYNDITHDNLSLIRSLKDEIAEMRAKEKANQKKMHQLTIDNKNLTEPLAQKEKARAELQEQLKYCAKDKMALKNLRARSTQLEQKMKDAKTEYMSLEGKFEKTEKERDDLYRRFQKGVREIQRKAEFKNVVLEKKLDSCTGQFHEKQAQLSEVLQAAKLDPAVVASVTKKLEQVLGSKNRLIKDLQYQVHQSTKCYNDTIRVYESKLPGHGIPGEEIGFEPIQTATSLCPRGSSRKLL